tara:strand:+ start:437 stop:760 length:324 start_codon:yes stop_codon:yes gene_type:complete
MEPIDGVNFSEQNKVIDLKLYKNKKRKQKQLYLLIGDYYEHKSLPIQITILSLSAPNPFTHNQIYLAVDMKGQIVAFEEGVEHDWKPITKKYFIEQVEKNIDDSEKV